MAEVSAACDEASGSGASALAPAAGTVAVAPSGWVDGSEAIADKQKKQDRPGFQRLAKKPRGRPRALLLT